MYTFDEDDEYERFGSRRNTLLLKVVVDIAQRHDVKWKLEPAPNGEFSMSLFNADAEEWALIDTDALGRGLEAALDQLDEWVDEDYAYNRRCTFYGLDAHDNEIQWLNGPAGKRGYWANPGQVWSENRINEIDVPADAVFESVVTGQMYHLPYAGQFKQEGLMVLGTAHTHPLENNPKFFYHPPPEWIVR